MSRYNISYYAARSGRVIKEDGTYVNVADGLNEDGSQNARIIYGPDGQPLSESNPLPAQLKGSNIENLFPGAVTKTMLAGRQRGMQYDTGATPNPKLEPGASASGVADSGAAQGVWLRV